MVISQFTNMTDIINIYPDSKKIIRWIFIESICFVALLCIFFFTGFPEVFGFLFWLIVILFLYRAIETIIKLKILRNKEAYIVFKNDSIKLNDRLFARSFKWGNITGWKISEEHVPFLIIKTANERRKVNLSFADKTVKEIKEMMEDMNRRNATR